MATFHLSIVTANGTAFEDHVESIVLPGADGRFGVLANHTPLIAALQQGLAEVIIDGKEKFVMIGEGYADIANNTVSIIVGEAAEVKDRETAENLLKSEHPWKTISSVNIF